MFSGNLETVDIKFENYKMEQLKNSSEEEKKQVEKQLTGLMENLKLNLKRK